MFLAIGISKIVKELDTRCNFFNIYEDRIYVKCKTGDEVGYLASKILKKANIEKYGLVELAGQVGLDIKEPISECLDRDAKSVFKCIMPTLLMLREQALGYALFYTSKPLRPSCLCV